MIEEIAESWGWCGIEPEEILGENDFGNLIIRDIYGKYWRLCPEDPYCKVIAQTRNELDTLSRSQDFLEDWYMKPLVEVARDLLGPLKDGMKYCMRAPGILGGEYGGSNLAMAPFTRIIRFSGNIGEQIKDLPDGTKVKYEAAF